MENTAVVLILLSMVGMILSLVGLIKGNLKFLKISGRKSSLFLLISCFVLFLVGGALVPVDEVTVSKTNTSQEAGGIATTKSEEVTSGRVPAATDTDETSNDDGANASVDKSEAVDNSVNKVVNQTTETPVEKPSTTPTGDLKVHYIDVGQGASQLIISPGGKVMLIDGGNNDDEGRVVNYLKNQGVKKVDILIGTHPDADHIGGLDAVVDAFDIGYMYMPKVSSNTKTFESLLTSISNKNMKVSTAKAGIDIKLDEQLTVKMIAPVNTYEDKNNMSAVIKLTFGSNSFLFTGDAEAESEQDILSSGTDLKADVLLVGHHGSNSSTSQSFLNAVNPKYAVIQVGDNNYGHPTDHILKRLADKNIKVYRNDRQGNIIFTSNGEKITSSQNAWKASTTTTVDRPKVTQPSKPTNKVETPVDKESSQNTSVYYKNCSAVREAGKAPLYKGDPGYSTKLDRDGDGVACE